MSFFCLVGVHCCMFFSVVFFCLFRYVSFPFCIRSWSVYTVSVCLTVKSLFACPIHLVPIFWFSASLVVILLLEWRGIELTTPWLVGRECNHCTIAPALNKNCFWKSFTHYYFNSLQQNVLQLNFNTFI
jgi:hypothetical protein